MAHQKPREERRTILLHARLRAEDGWFDVTIANVSRRGMLIRCPTPPTRSDIIEIRHRGLCVVGRVMWSNGAHCGIRSQDPIDFATLADKPPLVANPNGMTAEKRAVPRAPERSTAAMAEASKRMALFLNWSLVAAAGAIGAFMLASAASSSLEAPFSRAAQAMAQRGG